MELALRYVCWMSKWRNRSKYLADVPQDSVGRGDTQSDPSFIQTNVAFIQSDPSLPAGVAARPSILSLRNNP